MQATSAAMPYEIVGVFILVEINDRLRCSVHFQFPRGKSKNLGNDQALFWMAGLTFAHRESCFRHTDQNFASLRCRFASMYVFMLYMSLMSVVYLQDPMHHGVLQ